MKKLAYITLIAAFVFGVQTQEAFSSENNAIEIERGGKGEARAAFDQNSEILHVSMHVAGGRERVQILVYNSNGNVVAKEAVVATSRGLDVQIDLAGTPGGAYAVKVVSESIKMSTRFKKK